MGFRPLGQLAKGGHIRDGDLGENFPVQLDSGLLETSDKLLIGKSADSSGRVDPRDPKAAKLSATNSAISVGKRKRALDGLPGGPVQPAPAPDIAFGELHYFFLSLPGFTSTLGSWHCSDSFRVIFADFGFLASEFCVQTPEFVMF